MTLTHVSSSDDFFQDFVSECSFKGLYDDIIRGIRGQTDQGGAGGRSRETHLPNKQIFSDNSILYDTVPLYSTIPSSFSGSHLEHIFIIMSNGLTRHQVAVALLVGLP